MIDIRMLSEENNFSDLISLSRLFFEEYERHHEDFFEIGALKDQDVVDYFSSFLRQEHRNAFVAVDSGRIVGYITVYVKRQAEYWQVKTVGEISGLMVHNDYRRQGLAARLLSRAKDFFSSQGVKYYTVYTAVANQAGLDFYRNQGLEPIYTTFIGAADSTHNLDK